MNEDTLKLQTLEFVKTAGEVISDLQEKVAALSKENADLKTETDKLQKLADEKTSTNKEASAKPEVVFTEDAVKNTVSNMVKAGFLKESDQKTAESKLIASPQIALALLDKLAERELGSNLKPLGKIEAVDSKKPVAPVTRKSDQVWETRFNAIKR